MRQRLIITCGVLGLVVLGAWAIQAQPPIAGKETTVGIQHVAVNRQTSVDCNLCFTCGGDWPIFAGTIPTLPNNIFLLNTEDPVERGSSCSGGLIRRQDTQPFLCCK
jgi:hypothetical protein